MYEAFLVHARLQKNLLSSKACERVQPFKNSSIISEADINPLSCLTHYSWVCTVYQQYNKNLYLLKRLAFPRLEKVGYDCSKTFCPIKFMLGSALVFPFSRSRVAIWALKGYRCAMGLGSTANERNLWPLDVSVSSNSWSSFARTYSCSPCWTATFMMILEARFVDVRTNRSPNHPPAELGYCSYGLILFDLARRLK